MKKYLIILLLILFPALCFGAGQATSSKTGADIVTEARYLLNETTAKLWTDAELLEWADYAVNEIVAKTHCLQDEATIVLTTDAMEYAWSGVSNYIAIKGAVYYNGSEYKGLIKTDIMSIGHTSETGSPEKWYEWNDMVGVWPVPTSAYSGETVYAYYVPLPTGISASTSQVETPSLYDEALVWFVVAQAKLKYMRYQEAGYYLNKYNALLDRYRIDLVDKPKDKRTDVSP